MGKRGKRQLRQERIAAIQKKGKVKEPTFLKWLAAIALILGVILLYQLFAQKEETFSHETLHNVPNEEMVPVTAQWLQTLKPTITPKVSAHPEITSAPMSGTEILIYHTHATEAYTMTSGSSYVKSGEWRTEDENHNVIAVGALLAKELEKHGFTVYHDTTNYESPRLSTAYSRSLIGMEKYASEHPKLRYFIDLHRDAFGSGESGQKDYVLIEEKACARMMFVVGTGEGALGGGFGEMPAYEENLSFAQKITEKLRTVNELLMRDVRVKTGRYNQHVSDRCLLVEVGHNQNTLEQVKNSIPYLARAIAETIKEDVG